MGRSSVNTSSLLGLRIAIDFSYFRKASRYLVLIFSLPGITSGVVLIRKIGIVWSHHLQIITMYGGKIKCDNYMSPLEDVSVIFIYKYSSHLVSPLSREGTQVKSSIFILVLRF